MDEKLLIKLLQTHFAHQRKVREFAGKINLSYLEVDLLSLVLDTVGVPADNTIEQIEKYGYSNWLSHPDTFSREWHYHLFETLVRHGDYEACKAYLEEVTVSSTLYYLLDLETLTTTPRQEQQIGS